MLKLALFAVLAIGMAGAEAIVYEGGLSSLDISKTATSHWKDGSVMSSTVQIDGYVTIHGTEYKVRGVIAQVLGDAISFGTGDMAAYLFEKRDGWDGVFYAYDGIKLVSYDAKLSAAGEPISSTEEEEPEKPASKPAAKSGSKDNLEVITEFTQHNRLYQNFEIEVKVYDKDVNPNPRINPHNGGLLNDVPIKVSLTNVERKEKIYDASADTKNGAFSDEYTWKFDDPIKNYDLMLDVGNGKFTETRRVYYFGFVEERDDGVPPEIEFSHSMEEVEALDPMTRIVSTSVDSEEGVSRDVYTFNDTMQERIGRVTATDNIDPAPSLVHDIDMEGYALGPHMITWTATDRARNDVTELQNFTLVDTTEPVIMISKNETNVEAAGPITMIVISDEESGMSVKAVEPDVDLGTVTVTDTVDQELSLMYNITEFKYTLGTYTIEWTATDDSGNTGMNRQTFTIKDTTGPVITLSDEDPTCTETGDEIMLSIPNANATDTVDGVVEVDRMPAEDTFDTIPQSITWNATDMSGNPTMREQPINIQCSTDG